MRRKKSILVSSHVSRLTSPVLGIFHFHVRWELGRRAVMLFHIAGADASNNTTSNHLPLQQHSATYRR